MSLGEVNIGTRSKSSSVVACIECTLVEDLAKVNLGIGKSSNQEFALSGAYGSPTSPATSA